MKRIGVLYGYGSKDELIGAGAQQVCATPPAIPGCISRVFSAEPATDSNAGSAVNLS
jgi:phosphoglycolate phosphatase